MVGTRSALIVATYAYDDPGLTRLQAPQRDAEELAEVLGDPLIGGFEVECVVNQPWHEVNLAVARFFHNRRTDDLLLLHFSCHGLKDDSGELYFAATDTHLDLLEATGVPSSFVSRAMDRSRAGRVLLLLDCCYSGAFARGMTPRAAGAIDVNERLGGRGRAVITASSALQFAFEGDALADGDVDASQPSVFTSALVKGLRTGEADRDLDGWVSLDELYAYVHDEVTRVNPDQTPKKWAFDVEGDVYVARRGLPVATPSELPSEIRDSMGSLLTWEREAAVQPLLALLAGPHPGRALAARLALQQMAAADDSDRVKEVARAALASDPVEPPREEPDDRPVARPVGPPRTPEQAPPATSGPGAEPSRRAGFLRHGPAVLVPAVAALALVGILGVGALLKDPEEGASSSPGATGGAPRLADSEMLLTVRNDEGRRQLVAYDVESEASKVVIDDPRATLPTVSPDRQWVVYLKGLPNGGRVPHLARVDGSEDAPLLDADATNECPFAHRPSWSPDGERLAFVCVGGDGGPTGLWTLTRDGALITQITDSSRVVGSPTWTGEDTIVYEAVSEADSETSTLWSVPADGGEAVSLTDGVDGSDSHPDWSDAGLLFLRSAPGATGGAIVLRSPAGRFTTYPSDGTIQSPTWSADGEAVTWLKVDDSGDATLWVSTDPDSDPRQLGLSGDLGPPAWGSR